MKRKKGKGLLTGALGVNQDTSSIRRMDRSILFIYASRFKGIKTGFLREGFLGMGVVSRGSLMKFRMSWYGCGFTWEFNEIQDVMV